MYITVTMKMKDQSFDIRVDNRQVIREAEEILRSSGRYCGGSSDFYRSLLQCEIVSGYLSFLDAGINSGDVLAQV